MTTSAVAFERGKQQFTGVFSDIWVASATVDPASAAAEGTASDTITVSGVQLGDMVIAFGPGVALTDNLIVQCHVSAANTVKIQYTNNNVAAGAAIDLASSTWHFLIGRPRTHATQS